MSERIIKQGGNGIEYHDSMIPETWEARVIAYFIVTNIFVGVPLLAVLLEPPVRDYFRMLLPLLWISFFLFMALAPLLYNLSSPFEEGRTLIKSFRGQAKRSWLFSANSYAKLLIYEDGVELRVENNRYFIPYSKMNGIPKKGGIITPWLYIRSDLPGVPHELLFSKTFGGQVDDIVEMIGKARTGHMEVK